MKGSLSVAYVALAVLANWLASKYIVGVPFTAYVAPAGVFCIGAILVLRDWIQQLTSLRYTLLLVPIGGGLSYWKAAGERHATGSNILRSLDLNQQRWGYSDELKLILENTARELGLV